LPVLEAGLFFVLLGIGFAGIVLIRAFGALSMISGICFILLALAMFSGYEVSSTKQVYATNNTYIDHDEKTILIASNQLTLGYVFLMLAILSFALFALVVVLGR